MSDTFSEYNGGGSMYAQRGQKNRLVSDGGSDGL